MYYPWIYLTSGAERTILELSRRSRHQWTLFTNRYEPEHTFPEFSEQRVVALQTIPVERDLANVAAAMKTIVSQKLPLDGFSILVVVCEGAGDLVVLRNQTLPAICVCLTPLRIAYDSIYRQRCLQERIWLQKISIRAGCGIFRSLDRAVWSRYARIVCISQEAKRRALAARLARPEKIEVVHPGLGFYPAAPSNTFGHFFLLPGRIMWTKNLELGIKAFQRFQALCKHASDFRLVIAGIVDDKSRPYFDRLRAMAGNGGGVEFVDAPSDRDLAELYRNCYSVLFTAFNEDWGIVPLEAMAFGKPVIAVNRGGPLESISHGRDGFLEDPQPDAFAYRMRRLVENRLEAFLMGRAGFQTSRRYSWDGFVGRVDQVIEEVALARSAAKEFGSSRLASSATT
jgi:glycosyltransferase involved in cell wall biosynthesis